MLISPKFQYDYDVFLSYSRKDQEIVGAIATMLREKAHLLIFLDQWCLIPGEPWQEAIEHALDRSPAVVVFLGMDGISPWENEEMRAALDLRVSHKKIRVIPVLLPGAEPKIPSILPMFLRRLTWVDYRMGVGDENAFRRLVAGILGVQPGSDDTLREIGSQKNNADNKPRIVHALPAATDFEDRPELAILRQNWCQPYPKGVVALIGLGGSGKTALVNRLLQEMPDTTIDHLEVPKNNNLPSPKQLFVWSFYDQPDVNQFMQSLYSYLAGEQLGQMETRDISFRLVEFLERNAYERALVIMDGLETVQEGGSSNAPFGLIRDSSLRHFLRRVAQGINGFLVILTTRFAIPDLLTFQKAGYLQIDTDQLDIKSARRLLRSRGVKGGDEKIDVVIKTFGSHALTLDHLGALLRDFFNGDPEKARELPSLERIKGEVRSEYQAYRLARIFEFYEKRLPKEEIDLLENLCVFRIPVDLEIITKVFTEPEKQKKEKVSKMKKTDFLDLLYRLKGRRLITINEQSSSTLCNVHPAIRDHFYHALGTNATDVHQNISRHLVSLVERPERDRYPLDAIRLDILEEIIYHSIKSGQPEDAFRYYRQLMGRYLNLGWRLGAYQRGVRIVTMLLDNNITQERSGLGLLHELALFKLELGKVEEARDSLYLILEPYKDRGRFRDRDFSSLDGYGEVYLDVISQDLCDSEILLGHLMQAEMIQDRIVQSINSGDRELERRTFELIRFSNLTSYSPYGRRAYAKWLQGNVKESIADYKQTLALFGGIERRNGYYDLGFHRNMVARHKFPVQEAISYAELLLHLGYIQLARKNLSAFHDTNRLRDFPSLFALSNLSMANIARASGEIKDAKERATNSLAWGIESGHKLIICMANLNLARALFVEGVTSQSENYADDALSLARECGFRLYEIDTLITSGLIALVKNDYEKAYELAGKALEYSDEYGCNYQWGIGDSLHIMGKALIRKGKIKDACDILSRAKDVRIKLSDARLRNTLELIDTIDRKE